MLGFDCHTGMLETVTAVTVGRENCGWQQRLIDRRAVKASTKGGALARFSRRNRRLTSGSFRPWSPPLIFPRAARSFTPVINLKALFSLRLASGRRGEEGGGLHRFSPISFHGVLLSPFVFPQQKKKGGEEKHTHTTNWFNGSLSLNEKK